MTSLPFIDLQDSPIFRMRASELEAAADSLRAKSKKLVAGAARYRGALEQTFEESMRFADCLEAFCSGEDEESLTMGGPTIKRFVQTLRELNSFVELLRTQVDLILCQRLSQQSEGLAADLRAARKTLSQRSSEYDSARSRHLGHRSLAQRAPWANGKASTPEKTQQAMATARAAADEARYELARKLVQAQGQHRFGFLENVASLMQAHLKYFEHGSAVVQTLGPYIDETLELASRLKSDAQRQQDALEDLIMLEHQAAQQAGDAPAESLEEQGPLAAGPLQMSAATTQLAWELEAHIRATAESRGAEVTVLRQGYLLKQSSTMKSKWQRRFFVLDSRGMLYYYSTKGERPLSGGAAGRDQHPQATVNLLTATVKPGTAPEMPIVPFAFRVVSPEREYCLQAEDEAAAKAWMEVLQGVIACLLSGVIEIDVSRPLTVPSRHRHASSASSELAGLKLDRFDDQPLPSPLSDSTSSAAGSPLRSSAGFAFARAPQQTQQSPSPLQVLGAASSILGNDKCADCGAPQPDWGSLNLGTLQCIECVGFHRKLGVHVSKVRSLTLDVRAWDATVIALFQCLGNSVANAEWEATLAVARPSTPGGEDWVWQEGSDDEGGPSPAGAQRALVAEAQRMAAQRASQTGLPPKPTASSSAAAKEHFIVAKYQQRAFALRSQASPEQLVQVLWDAVAAGNVQEVYRVLVHGAQVGMNVSSSAASQLVLDAHGLGSSGGAGDQAAAPMTGGPGATVLHAAAKVSRQSSSLKQAKLHN